MTIWRPRQTVQVKALGLAWRDGRLLASEVHADDGSVKGVRPLGGTVEFGESWRETLVREFMEELSIEVEVTGAPIVMENLYSHEGQVGHEILFLADIALPASKILSQDWITYRENNGTTCRAGWFDLESLERDGPTLFPMGLGDVLRDPRVVQALPDRAVQTGECGLLFDKNCTADTLM